MLNSPVSLASAQLGRNSVAEVAEARTPWREAALEAFRRRNAILDTIFYDVGRVSADEAQRIGPWLAREGSILIVPPTGAGALRLCEDPDDFAAHGGRDVRALTVAGVGSSALGSAAYARNVADAFGAPVASVVSGYGLSDALTEAFGGWFFFGTLNRLRHEFELMDDLTRNLRPFTPARFTTDTAANPAAQSLDTRTVRELLSDRRFRFSLLSGHSKGNLVISEALFDLDEQGKGPGDDTWIITVSAVIAMPERFRNVVDVIGDIDWFGELNSELDLDVEERPKLAWHGTNTELMFPLRVTEVFGKLIRERGIRLEPPRPAQRTRAQLALRSAAQMPRPLPGALRSGQGRSDLPPKIASIRAGASVQSPRAISASS